MNPLVRILVVPALLLLSACATLDKDECLNADWELIGYEDGTKGYAATRIGNHRKACSKYGVTPDLASYTKGRERGLIIYCTPQNGYVVGQKTLTYQDVCPANLKPAFKKAFSYGNRIRRYRLDIRQFERDISKSRKLIIAMQEELDINEALIIRGARGPRERAALVRRNRELRHLIADEDDRIARAAYEIEQINYLVAELIEHSPYR